MKQETQKNRCSISDKRYVISDRGGFSFIEVMLAVFLLSTGMVAAISLISAGLKESMDSRNQLIASLLTQEGVELVRNIRDNNQAQSIDAFTGINDGTWKTQIGSTIVLSPVGASAVLNYDSAKLEYKHSGWTATKFSREIFVSTDLTGNEKTVTSVVSWKGTFPNPVNVAVECTTSAGCAYAQAVITK